MDLPRRRDDCPLRYEYVKEIPSLWDVYQCERYGKRTKYRFHVCMRLPSKDRYIDMLNWCYKNTQGAFCDWSEFMGDPEPGTEEGVAFELEEDAVSFKLRWIGD